MPSADFPRTLPATNEDTSGPCFPITFADPAPNDLTRVDPGGVAEAKGTPIVIRGQVLDRHGDLADGAIPEFWQANAAGVYRTPATGDHADIDPWFHGYGRVRTASGTYTFRTAMTVARSGARRHMSSAS